MDDCLLTDTEDLSRSNSTMDLTATVLSWSGMADTVDLEYATQKVLSSTKAGIAAASLSDKLSLPDAIKLKDPADVLVGHVRDTVDALIQAQPNFGVFGSLIWLQLRIQKKTAADFNEAVVNISPDFAKDAVLEFGQQIDEALEDAIAAYRPYVAPETK